MYSGVIKTCSFTWGLTLPEPVHPTKTILVPLKGWELDVGIDGVRVSHDHIAGKVEIGNRPVRNRPPGSASRVYGQSFICSAKEYIKWEAFVDRIIGISQDSELTLASSLAFKPQLLVSR